MEKSKEPDVNELEDIKGRLKKAKEDNTEATEEILANANEFARNSDDDVIIKAARVLQMISSVKWYQFWEKATKIPKDNKYETFTTNEKRTWKTIARANEEFLREVVSEEGIDGITWTKVSSKNGVNITFSPEKTQVFKTKMYKVETMVPNVSPKLLLLALVRGPVMGLTDDNLIYFREHYNFVGGKTSLIHTIRKIISTDKVNARDFFDLTHWTEDEDGSIYFTASSVKAASNQIPGIVRGATLFKGISLKAVEGKGTELVMVSQVSARGWVPEFVLNWYVPSALQAEISALGKAAATVKDNGEDEIYIRKFVERALVLEKL